MCVLGINVSDWWLVVIGAVVCLVSIIGWQKWYKVGSRMLFGVLAIVGILLLFIVASKALHSSCKPTSSSATTPKTTVTKSTPNHSAVSSDSTTNQSTDTSTSAGANNSTSQDTTSATLPITTQAPVSYGLSLLKLTNRSTNPSNSATPPASSASSATTSSTSTSTSTTKPTSVKAVDDGPFYIGTSYTQFYLRPLANDSAGTSTIDQSTVDLDPSTPAIDTKYDIQSSDGSLSANATYQTDTNGNGYVIFNYLWGWPYYQGTPLPEGTKISVPYRFTTTNGKQSTVAHMTFIIQGNLFTKADIISDDSGIAADGSVNVAANDGTANVTVDPTTVDLDPYTPGIQKTYVSPVTGTVFTIDNSGMVTAHYPGSGVPIAEVISYTIQSTTGVTSSPTSLTVSPFYT